MTDDTNPDGPNRPLKPYRIVDGHAQYLTPDQQRDVMEGVIQAEKWREQHNRNRKPAAKRSQPKPTPRDLDHIGKTILRIREDLLRVQRAIAPDSPTEDQIWAAMTLCLNADACTSVLDGKPVLAKHLDGAALTHALRGRPRPTPDSYITITPEMLDGIVEAGPPAA